MLYSFSTIAIKTVLGYSYNIRPAGEINQLLVFNLKMDFYLAAGAYIDYVP